MDTEMVTEIEMEMEMDVQLNAYGLRSGRVRAPERSGDGEGGRQAKRHSHVLEGALQHG